MEQYWASSVYRSQSPSSVAKLACGCNLHLRSIPERVAGMSVGDLIIVPSRVIHPKQKPFIGVANQLVAERSRECRRIASAHTHTWESRSTRFCHLQCAQGANENSVKRGDWDDLKSERVRWKGGGLAKRHFPPPLIYGLVFAHTLCGLDGNPGRRRSP